MNRTEAFAPPNRHQFAYTTLLTTGALFLAACGGDASNAGGGPSWTAAVDTVGDTVTVRTESGQMWKSDATLVSEVSIGVLDGDEQYQLGNVRAIAAADDGRIFTTDAHGPVLRVYGPDGIWLQDFGHQGEGPGEIKRPDAGLSILPDGRVAIRDPGNARISIYSPEGEFLDYLPIAGGFSTSDPMTAQRIRFRCPTSATKSRRFLARAGTTSA